VRDLEIDVILGVGVLPLIRQRRNRRMALQPAQTGVLGAVSLVGITGRNVPSVP
jgi:hypothetical protein